MLLVSTNADLAGAPIHVSLLAKELSARGLQVHVAFGEEGPVRNELDARGIHTYVLPTIRSNLNLIQDVRSILSLRRLMRKLRPDLVHSHSSKAGMVARIAALLCRIPAVFTIHGWGFGPGRDPRVSILVRTIERVLRKYTKHYIAVSEYDRNVGIQELGIPESEISRIYNGIPDAPIRSWPEQSSSIIMVARFAPPKDYATLLQASDNLSCEVICVGGGTDSDDFRRLVRELAPNGAGRIRTLGVRKDIDRVLAECGVFVLSSRFEGLPISIIEAMRAGLPIVASNVGGVAELVIEGRNGFLFETGDVATLTTLLARLSADSALRKQLGDESRELFFRLFTVESMIDSTLQVYEKVAGSATPYTASEDTPSDLWRNR